MDRPLKILVSGHLGFLGSRLYSKLKKSGKHEVYGLDIKNGPQEDIGRTREFNKFKSGLDVVFHCAAIPRVGLSVEQPSFTLEQNVLNTSKLLQYSKDIGVKKFIFSSSSAIYGDLPGIVRPKSPYGLHKLMSEQECSLYRKLYNMQTICLRYFNIYSEDQPTDGAYSTVIAAWVEALKNNKQVRIDGDGSQRRDFVYVDDVVDANIFMMNYDGDISADYNTFDVGTGTNVSLMEIVKYLMKYDKDFHKRISYAASRTGDAFETLANTETMSQLGWTAKIDIQTGLDLCFKDLLEKNNRRK